MRFSFIYAFVMMFMMCFGLAGAQTAVTPAGSGTENDPYQITELGNLVWMSDTVTSSSGKYYKMINDIDAAETSSWNDGAGFVPIGTESTPFMGLFDGNGKKITGLTINRSSATNVGFFGYASGCTINNFAIEGGSVTGYQHIGGLVGLVINSTISNCYSTCNAAGGFCEVGSLVGYKQNGTISNCYATGNVSGDSNVASLVGRQDGGSISNCYSTGSTEGRWIGSLVGLQDAGTITNCYATGYVNGTQTGAAGGLLCPYSGGTVSNSYYDSQTTGRSDTGKGTPKTTAQMKQQSTFNGWDFTTDTWKIVEGASYPYLRAFGDEARLRVSVIGNGTVTPPVGVHSYAYDTTVSLNATPADGWFFLEWHGVNIADADAANTTVSMDCNKSVIAHFRKKYEIRTLAELQAVKDDLDGDYILMNDIDASETATWNAGLGFVPIGTSTAPFTGLFDGNGKKITGLTINRSNSSTDYVGLFGYIGSGSIIKDLGLEGGSVTGGSYVGGLVGNQGFGTITNCYASGAVTGSGSYVGDLVGYQYSGTITNCYASGAVTGGSYVGGLVGNQGFGTITNCYATGPVSGNQYVGGLMGYQFSGTITNCYASGRVSGSSYVGGLVGHHGFGTITNCYASGSVSGSSYVGGLVGHQYSGTITNCYANGSVSGTNYVGGLVGHHYGGTITNCYYDSQTTGQSDTGKGNSKRTTEMRLKGTFVDWDFSDVWGIVEGLDYPFLRSFKQCGSLSVTLAPVGAVSAGAQWSLNGGVTWNASGATVSDLPVGAYTITYKTIADWDAPSDKSVSVVKDEVVNFTGTYVQHMGSLKVTMVPQTAIDAGAQWSVDGGATWNDSGTEINLSVGEHTVQFKELEGWLITASQSVVVRHYQLTSVVVEYISTQDMVLVDGDFDSGVGASIAPGAKVDFWWDVTSERPVTEPFWCELFASKTGGFDQVRFGSTVTGSYKQNGMGTYAQIAPSTLTLNTIPDGVYTLLPSVNRGSLKLSDRVSEISYSNNWMPVASKRLSVHNPVRQQIDLVLENPQMVHDATDARRVTVTGRMRNAGSVNLAKPGAWVEVFYGTLTAEGTLMPQGTIGAGQNINTLAAGESAEFSLSGTVPAGVANRALAVIVDSTDIVPETNEVNNSQLFYDESILPPGKDNGIDLAIVSMTANAAQLVPNAVAPNDKLQYNVTVQNKGTVMPSGKVYIELFASQDGCVSYVPGVTLTWSEQITAPELGEFQTYQFEKPLNSIGDGVYSLVAVINRAGVSTNPGDMTPLDNRYSFSGGRVFLNTPVVSGSVNLVWSEGPTFTDIGAGRMRIDGRIKNIGDTKTRAFWTEAFVGTVQAKTGYFYKDTNTVFAGGINCTGLEPNEELVISTVGKIPVGKIVGVLADSTDVVAETDETDNYDYSELLAQ